MRFEKLWVEQCCHKAIERRFGARSVLDYLIDEKLITDSRSAASVATTCRVEMD
jgi:hypothetical protein